MPARLAEAPDRVCDAEGQPRFGAYQGVMSDGSLTGLAPGPARAGLARLRSEKCWHYACIAGPGWVAGLAIVRLGYAGAGFAYLFDRQQGRFLVDQSVMGPPLLAARIAERPGDGAQSVFRVPGFRASILKPPGLGRYQVRIRLTSLPEVFDLAAELHADLAPRGLSAVCPVGGQGSVNLTVKQVALPARGRLVLGERSQAFEAYHFGLLDFSHGYLDRTTSWMWAAAGGVGGRGRTLGLNLVAGFNQGLENAVWLDDRPIPVGPVVFHRQTSGPTAPWSIRDQAGRVDLTFTPEGARSDQRDLGPISSHYFQPVGTFSGTLKDHRGRRVPVRDLVGVCEEHFSRW